jgi:uncharacterized protein YndB with AHSA1/START domain
MVLHREIRAPRALVWDVWTDPETLPRWWGPDGFYCRQVLRRATIVDQLDGGSPAGLAPCGAFV